MKTRKTSYPPVNIGASLMLVIFIILCMVVFAVLSLSSALKDLDYSEKNALRTSSYYEASNRAEELLAQIDTILAETPSREERIQKLQTFENVTAAEEGFELVVTYSVPIDEDEILQITLAAPFQTPETHVSQRYTIRSWTQCSAAEWTGTQSLPVLGSDSF